MFVEVNRKRSSTEGLDGGQYAFVQYYVSAVSPDMRTDEDRTETRMQRNDLSITNRYNHLPYVYLDPDVERRYGLIDTSTIVSGLWIQEDFTNKGKYWVLTVSSFN